SAAKGVRRHGVGPNRSRNEEVKVYKNREGQNGNLAKSQILYPLSLFLPVTFSLLPLSPSRDLGSCEPFAFQGTARPPQAESRSPPLVPTGPTSCRRHNLTISTPEAALSWPEKTMFSDGGFLQSHPNFQLRFLLHFLHQNRSSKASEVQPISMRKLQRVKLAWTICRRRYAGSTTGPIIVSAPRGDSAEFSAEV
ncbi:hypothetical protein Prudu_395S000400, partial [Prunus dulcis]